MITDVYFDEESFGITQRSLKVLRDALARSIDHQIAVVEVPTNDLCSGFLILNKSTGIATFTGDGFRMDGGGEGGAGRKSAMALLTIYGIIPILWEPESCQISIDEIYQGEKEKVKRKILNLAKDISKTLTKRDYIKVSKKRPYYVR